MNSKINMIEITIPLRPITVNKAYVAFPIGRRCTRVKSQPYKQFEKDALKILPAKEMITGKLEVELDFYIKRETISDVDNFAKTTLDVITKAGYIEDDRFIYKLTLKKFKSKEEFIEIRIKEYDK
jgi:Holliday junction resolvase RusA-like endonuclease